MNKWTQIKLIQFQPSFLPKLISRWRRLNDLNKLGPIGITDKNFRSLIFFELQKNKMKAMLLDLGKRNETTKV